MNSRMTEVKEWLQKAENDLRSAQILLEYAPDLTDMVAFHSQQAVEKALKAFLVWKTVPFEKVHSLTYLLDLCEAEESKFASIRDEAEILAPYAVEVRYPGALMNVPWEEAAEALRTAKKIWHLVLGFLPPEIGFAAETGPEVG